MPQPRIPPTPASSTDIIGKDSSLNGEMESVFSLPPPALPSKSTTADTRSLSRSTAATIGHSSPPLSPKDRQVGPTRDRKRTLSGTSKQKPNAQAMSLSLSSSSSAPIADSALPPPPSRARKIIQMKPKQGSNGSNDHKVQSSPRTTSLQKDVNATPQSTSKRKQTQTPNSSAAGRKIARKTAHSIIERRRRNKMNEEFAVLKDMIPACYGVEMHKLAILQAGIEYVRYLEGCIEHLKAQNGSTHERQSTPHHESIIQEQDNDDDDDDDDDERSMDVDQDDQQNCFRPASSAAALSESETSSPLATPKLPATRLEQKPLPAFRTSSVVTSTANSTYASPVLHPIMSHPPPSFPSVYQTSQGTSRNSAITSRTQSIYSTSPPVLVAKTPLQSGVSPAFEAFHFSPDLSRISTQTSLNDASVQVKSAPTILPLPQAAMALSQHMSLDMYNAGSGNSALSASHNADAVDGHAEATATAALLMMTKDRRVSVSRTEGRSGNGMSVKDLLSS